MTITPALSQPRPLRVALLGLGTVGGAVASRLLDGEWREHVAARGLRPPELVAVGVRDPSRPRAVTLPSSIEMTDDLERLVNQADVDVVVELLGGLEPAGGLTERALATGRAVVTANKQLLAERGPALEATARRSGAALRFEAAVAAGIPILGPLARDLSANHLELVRGIVNGTTNFILSAMYEQGRDYADALADAQQRGYAEADPAADVEGRDAAHKLVLLARLAFGAWLQTSAIRRAPAGLGGVAGYGGAGEGDPGITGVTAAEVQAARELGLAIKLVASVSKATTEAGTLLVASVEPCAVGRRSLLGSTDGVTNVVEVHGKPVGRVIFQGPGAGGDATSSAVLADLLALGRGEGSTWGTLPEAGPIGDIDDGRSLPGRWFYLTPERGGEVSEPMELEALRVRLARTGAPPATTIYRVLEDG